VAEEAEQLLEFIVSTGRESHFIRLYLHSVDLRQPRRWVELETEFKPAPADVEGRGIDGLVAQSAFDFLTERAKTLAFCRDRFELTDGDCFLELTQPRPKLRELVAHLRRDDGVIALRRSDLVDVPSAPTNALIRCAADAICIHLLLFEFNRKYSKLANELMQAHMHI